MEDSSYEALETEALSIVDTLNKLKSEIEKYKKATLGSKKSLTTLDGLVGDMSDAAKELAATTQKLQSMETAIESSDYVTLYEKLAQANDELARACQAVTADTEALPNSLKHNLEEANKSFKEQSDLLLNLITNEIAKREESMEKRNLDLLAHVETLADRVDNSDYATLFGHLTDTLDALNKSLVSTEKKLGAIEEKLDALKEEFGKAQHSISKLDDSLKSIDDKLNGLDSKLDESTKAMLEGISSHDKTNDLHIKELYDRIDRLETIIGRIDRNTQKGIGKEKG